MLLIASCYRNRKYNIYALHNCQSRCQSPQASWSAGDRRERLWGTGTFTAEILRLPVRSFVTVNSNEKPIKKSFFSSTPESLPATTH